MYPKSRGPPLPSSQAYAVRPQFSAVPAPSHPPPPPHSGTTSPHTPGVDVNQVLDQLLLFVDHHHHLPQLRMSL